jgi:hypothetical protein
MACIVAARVFFFFSFLLSEYHASFIISPFTRTFTSCAAAGDPEMNKTELLPLERGGQEVAGLNQSALPHGRSCLVQQAGGNQVL